MTTETKGAIHSVEVTVKSTLHPTDSQPTVWKIDATRVENLGGLIEAFLDRTMFAKWGYYKNVYHPDVEITLKWESSVEPSDYLVEPCPKCSKRQVKVTTISTNSIELHCDACGNDYAQEEEQQYVSDLIGPPVSGPG